MGKNFIKKTYDSIIGELKEQMNKASQFAKSEIEKRTPEDTKKLVGSYKISKQIIEGPYLIQKITNDTEYGIYVEWGVRGKAYNYNKPKGTIFRIGVGARMMKLTKEEKEKEIIDMVRTGLTTKIIGKKGSKTF